MTKTIRPEPCATIQRAAALRQEVRTLQSWSRQARRSFLARLEDVTAFTGCDARIVYQEVETAESLAHERDQAPRSVGEEMSHWKISAPVSGGATPLHRAGPVGGDKAVSAGEFKCDATSDTAARTGDDQRQDGSRSSRLAPQLPPLSSRRSMIGRHQFLTTLEGILICGPAFLPCIGVADAVEAFSRSAD